MPRGENRASSLLSPEENEQVFRLIGPKCQSLATAVVQLFTTEGPGHSEWRKKDTGVLCLIKDNGKRSYFFRIYCLFRKACIWEHEVYMQIEYKSPRPYLHTFEAEEYMTAFNFANEEEARLLRNILIEKIELRKQKREERRQRSLLAARANSGALTVKPADLPPAPAPGPRHNGAVAPPAALPQPQPQPQPVHKQNTLQGGYNLKSSHKKQKTRKLTKADIGAPQGFKHISHVGWDANKGFDVENLPEEEMRSFFSKAGISEMQLQDQATRQFIYDFINTHGGLDAVKEELTTRPAPAPAPAPAVETPRAPAPPPSRAPPPQLPPAPPSRAPPSPPARVPPPPPAAPPPRDPPPRPPQPPQPAPCSAPPPPPPPPPPAPGPAGDPRAALMESIRSGQKTLRKVEVGAKAGGGGGGAAEDSRSNLLSEIRQGVELRAVPRAEPESRAAARGLEDAQGLAGALARALQERSKALHSDSDSDDDPADTSDDEWAD